MRKYKIKHHQLTPAQIADIEALVMRSRCWRGLAIAITCTMCIVLRYPYDHLQPPHIWAGKYLAALAQPEKKHARETLLRLAEVSRTRSGIVMLLIYLAAQHARLQFDPRAAAEIPPQQDGVPWRLLDRHHRSVTRMLTRMLCAAVGCLDERYYARGWYVRAVRRIVHIVLGSGDRKISTHAVLCWISIGDQAAGVVSRRPDTLQKTVYSTAKVPLSFVLRREATALLCRAYFASFWRATKSALLAAGYVCLLGYLIRGLAMGAHIVSHLHR